MCEYKFTPFGTRDLTSSRRMTVATYCRFHQDLVCMGMALSELLSAA